MADQNSNNTTQTIVGFIAVALVAFSGGYFVGSSNPSSATGEAGNAVGGATAPEFAKKDGAANKFAPQNDSDLIPVGTSASLGPKDAPITVIEFSDYQCPYCSRGANTLKELAKKYPQDVRIVFKHFPLNFHKEAPAASKASMAAGEQGKFWEMHDKLFAAQREFRGKGDAGMKELTAGYAKELGLDVEKFKKDFDKPEYQQVIDADMKLGSKLQVRGTPHFFVNGERVKGALPLNSFEDIVKKQLETAKKLKASGLSSSAIYAKMVKDNYKAPEAQPNNQQKPASKVAFIPVDAKKDAMKGNTDDYLVTIVEFSDFQCPFCSKANTSVMKVLENYGKETRLVFKHLPLPFHKEAEPAARATLAAGKQGKFWEMHDLLFANQAAMKGNVGVFTEYAQQLGLNMDKYNKDFESEELKAQVKADMAQANKVGARGTPNFFINGVQLVGAQPYASFEAEMKKQIALAKKIQKEKNLKGEALYRAVAEHNQKNAPKAPPAQKPPAQKIDPNLLSVGNSYFKGPKNAPVKIYEFSDFQCPFCSRANNTIQQVAKKYEGKVQLVFKAYPLPFHKEAEPAHRAAIAAGMQGKFWEMHDKFFANQGGMKGKGDAGMQSMAEEYATELGLNLDKFKKDYASPEVAKQVKDEMAMGQKVGVRGTPNFFINGTRIVGAQQAPAFEAAIEEALKAKK